MADPMLLEPMTTVQRAFSKQAEHYDQDDKGNPILADWREKVYAHISHFIKPGSRMLEINAGTGIDASYFVSNGHTVHATDVSPGMVDKIREKIARSNHSGNFSAQVCSFETLDEIHENNFDYLFSNFGGLNCCEDLTRVTRHLPGLLQPGAFVSLVIMPPVCLWEQLRIFNGKKAFRRFKQGAAAQIDGEHFKTYYHSLSKIKASLGSHFQFLKAQGLGALSPPPSATDFISRHPQVYSFMKKLDDGVAGHFPFNRWADHTIATFKFIRP